MNDLSCTATSNLAAFLEQAPWWAPLSAGQQARVLAETQVRRIATGGFVCRKGEAVSHWIGVIDGLVRLGTHSADGKIASLTGIPAGAWFGEGSLLKDEARRYDAIALRDSRVAYMPRAAFHALLGESIPFNRFLLGHLNERLGQFIGTLESQRLADPDVRVATCLAWLFQPNLYPATGAQLRITQEELGLLSGVSRQRVNKALKTLAADGLLRVNYGCVTILDLDRLRAFGS